MMSRKKRDTMLSAAPTATNPAPDAIVVLGQQLNIRSATGVTSFLNGVHSFLNVPSYRTLSPNTGAFVAQRTAVDPYYIGLAERYSIIPLTASVWWWRRIVFASKRDFGGELSLASAIGAQSSPGALTQRNFRDMSQTPGTSSNNYGQLLTNVITELYEGIFTVDWTDPMRAKLDKSRVTVINDKLRTVKSNNDSPAPKVYNTYVPIKKTVVYQDEENGTNMSVSPISVTSKRGLGNIYVLDLFECPAAPGSTTDVLQVSSQQTLYWHEKN